MTKTSDHPYVETIRRYYEGCNTGDFDLMMSTFTEDVVHYFVDHAPVVSGERLANYWVKVGPRTQAHWTVDHALVDVAEIIARRVVAGIEVFPCRATIGCGLLLRLDLVGACEHTTRRNAGIDERTVVRPTVKGRRFDGKALLAK